jgi:hypothetical protein
MKKLDQPWGLLLGGIAVVSAVALVFLVFYQ